eukprot:9036918-Lingulodinium_polyedra.AAC.1
MRAEPLVSGEGQEPGARVPAVALHVLASVERTRGALHRAVREALLGRLAADLAPTLEPLALLVIVDPESPQ